MTRWTKKSKQSLWSIHFKSCRHRQVNNVLSSLIKVYVYYTRRGVCTNIYTYCPHRISIVLV